MVPRIPFVIGDPYLLRVKKLSTPLGAFTILAECLAHFKTLDGANRDLKPWVEFELESLAKVIELPSC